MKLATWMRQKDEKWFQPFFDGHPDLIVCDARQVEVEMDEMDGLLLTGGSDIAPEFLRQDVPDPSVLDKEVDPVRDAWEFAAIAAALDRALPIFAICKGMQTLNVALGGTLKLDIQGPQSAGTKRGRHSAVAERSRARPIGLKTSIACITRRSSELAR